MTKGTRERKAKEMMDAVIKKNGFEDENTIFFCELAEKFIKLEIDFSTLKFFHKKALGYY